MVYSAVQALTPPPPLMLVGILQVYGLKRLGCHAYLQTVSRCCTSGESEITRVRKHEGLALKPKADVTRSPKQRLSVAQWKGLIMYSNFFKESFLLPKISPLLATCESIPVYSLSTPLRAYLQQIFSTSSPLGFRLVWLVLYKKGYQTKKESKWAEQPRTKHQSRIQCLLSIVCTVDFLPNGTLLELLSIKYLWLVRNTELHTYLK